VAEERARTHATNRHDVVMVNRQAIEVTGVLDVESFDSREFILKTGFGYLAIHGEGLHIKALTLEKGVVSIEGTIADLSYFDEGQSVGSKTKGLFGRFLR